MSTTRGVHVFPPGQLQSSLSDVTGSLANTWV
jgi:hypothetical protein